MQRFIFAWMAKLKKIISFLRPRKKVSYFVPLFFVFVLVAGFMLFSEPTFAIVEMIMNGMIRAVSWLMLTVAQICIGLTIFFLRFFITLASYNNYIDVPVVMIGWVMVRDIANMFFVVALLVIAFATILGLEQYEWKKSLIKLIIVAIFINFSNMIAQLIIDVAHVFTMTFLNAVSATAGGNIINMFKLDHIVKAAYGWNPGVSSTGGTQMAVLGGAVIASLFAIASAVAMGAYVLVMALRVVTLWALIILSPFAYILHVLPKTQEYAKKWWSLFGKQVIVAPVMVFFLWLSFATLGQGDIVNKIEEDASVIPVTHEGRSLSQRAAYEVVSSGQPQQVSLASVSTWENMANYILAFIFMAIGIKVTQDTGAIGAGAIGKAADFGKKVATIATGYAAGRWLVGGAAKGAYGLGAKGLKEGSKGALWYMPLVGGRSWSMLGKQIKSNVHAAWWRRGTGINKKSIEAAGDLGKKRVEHEQVERELQRKDLSDERREELQTKKTKIEGEMTGQEEKLRKSIKRRGVIGWLAGRDAARQKHLKKSERQAETLKDVALKRAGASTGGWVFNRQDSRIKAQDRLERGILAGEKRRSAAKDKEYETKGEVGVVGAPRVKYTPWGASKTEQDYKKAEREGKKVITMADQIKGHERSGASFEDRIKALLSAAEARVDIEANLVTEDIKNATEAVEKKKMSPVRVKLEEEKKKAESERNRKVDELTPQHDRRIKAQEEAMVNKVYGSGGKSKKEIEEELEAERNTDDYEARKAKRAKEADTEMTLAQERFKEEEEKIKSDYDGEIADIGVDLALSQDDLAAAIKEEEIDRDAYQKLEADNNATPEQKEEAKAKMEESQKRLEEAKNAVQAKEEEKIMARRTRSDRNEDNITSFQASSREAHRNRGTTKKERELMDVLEAYGGRSAKEIEAEIEAERNTEGYEDEKERRAQEVQPIIERAERDYEIIEGKINAAFEKKIKDIDSALEPLKDDLTAAKKEEQINRDAYQELKDDKSATPEQKKEAKAKMEESQEKLEEAIDAVKKKEGDKGLAEENRQEEIGIHEKTRDEAIAKASKTGTTTKKERVLIDALEAEEKARSESEAFEAERERLAELKKEKQKAISTEEDKVVAKKKEIADFEKGEGRYKHDPEKEAEEAKRNPKAIPMSKEGWEKSDAYKKIDQEVTEKVRVLEEKLSSTAGGRAILSAQQAALADQVQKTARAQLEAGALGLHGMREMFESLHLEEELTSGAEKIKENIKKAGLKDIFKKGAKQLADAGKEIARGANPAEVRKNLGAGAIVLRAEVENDYLEDLVTNQRAKAKDVADSQYSQERFGFGTPHSAFKNLIKKRMDETFTGVEREQAVVMGLGNLSKLLKMKGQGVELEADHEAQMMANVNYLVKQAWSDDMLARIVDMINNKDNLTGEDREEAESLSNIFVDKFKWGTKGADGTVRIDKNISSNRRTNDLHRLSAYAGDADLVQSESAVLHHKKKMESETGNKVGYLDAAKDLAQKIKDQIPSGDVSGMSSVGMLNMASKLGMSSKTGVEELKAFSKNFTKGMKSAADSVDGFEEKIRHYSESNELMADFKNQALAVGHLDDGGHTYFDMKDKIARGQLAEDAMEFVLSDWRKLTVKERARRLKIHSVAQMDEDSGTVYMDERNVKSFTESLGSIESSREFADLDTRNTDQIAGGAAGESFEKDKETGLSMIGARSGAMFEKTYKDVDKARDLVEGNTAKGIKGLSSAARRAIMKKFKITDWNTEVLGDDDMLRQVAALSQIANNYAVGFKGDARAVAASIGRKTGVDYDQSVQGTFKVMFGDGRLSQKVKDDKELVEFVEMFRTNNDTIELNKKAIAGIFYQNREKYKRNPQKKTDDDD